MRFSSSEAVREYLETIPKFQSRGASAAKFDLSRFRAFCEVMGDPQEQFDAIHVAGTNGKGSTCNILSSVLEDGGYRVGVYTSPHILTFNERFRIGDQYITDDELLSFFNHFVDAVEKYELTYFEISTAIAFWWFAQSNIDIACIEVGLGGRLDATNVIDPLVSVITSVSLDHTDILGDNISDIAREKGGIIKKDRPVVIGELPKDAKKAIVKIAEQKRAPIFFAEDLNAQWQAPGKYSLTINSEEIIIKSNLTAPVQAKNLAVVWQVCGAIYDQYPIGIRDLLRSLKEVKTGLGRFEKLIENQEWYFDGGHNLEAVKALKQSVEGVGRIEEATLVLSMMRDKVDKEILAEFSEFKNIYYYPLALERAATFDDIKQWLPKANPFPASDKGRNTLLQDNFDSQLVIFSGSFYFYGTVRDWVSTFALNQ